MKYLNIHLLHNADSSIIYPANYQEEIGNFAKDHLYYKDDTGEDYLLLVIEDGDFKPEMLRANVIEETETKVVSISEANETRTETILDEAKVKRLEIKARLGMALTTDETDSLDPTKPDSCFGVEKILADRITDLKTFETVKEAK